MLVAELAAELRAGTPPRAGLESRLERDLGFDSLARVELLARIEKAFNVRLGENLLVSAETVADLLAAVEAGGGDTVPVPPVHRHKDVVPEAKSGFPATAMTLGEALDWHVQRHPDRTHVIFLRSDADTRVFSYRELQESARELAAGLRRQGVKAGDFVALMLPTGLEFFQSFYGILLVGAVPVPIYPPTRPSQLEDHLRRQAGILQNCEAVALVSFDAAQLVARVLTGLVPSLRSVTTAEALRTTGMAAGMGPDHEGSPGEIAFLQYTSGSTGSPKGVTLDHGNLLANIRAWGQAVGLGPADVVVSWLPLYHDMGLIGAWLGSLYHACPLVLMSPLDFLARPDRWLWAIHEYRGTVTAAPNFAFELCLRHADPQRLAGLDLGSWRYAANGAEPVSAETLSRFADAFRPYGFRAEALAPVYGLAECSVGLAVSPPGRGPRIDRLARAALGDGIAVQAGDEDPAALSVVACGVPLPGHQVKIVDQQGAALPPRHVGRLLFRGPSATRGYHRNPEATADLIRDGWLDSGDLGYLSGGDVFITGRAKDTIIRGGRNLYPYELELAVGSLPGIRRGCVAIFGAADQASGTERLVIVAECRVPDEASRRELIDRISARSIDLLGTPPDDVVLAPPHAVRKTSSGKIRRAATRDAYLAGELEQAGQAPWRQLLRLWMSGLRTRLGRGLEIASGIGAWFVCAGLLIPAGLALLIPGKARRWRWLSGIAGFGLRACGVRVTVTGVPPEETSPVIYVSNHASYIDVFVLLAVLPTPVRFVAKEELAGSRLLSGILRRLDTLFVDRFDARKGVEDVRRIGELMASDSLFVFAEGTFTARTGLLPFRLGAFRMAADNRRAVVPVALAGTRAILHDETWLPRRGKVDVTFGDPIISEAQGWEGALKLRNASRAFILERCDEPDLQA